METERSAKSSICAFFRDRQAEAVSGGCSQFEEESQGKVMRAWLSFTCLCFCVGVLLSSPPVQAQQVTDRIALKSGESVDLTQVYFVVNCRSIMIGLPEVEILEGPSEVALNVRQEEVVPLRQNCAQKVPGGTLVLTAKDVTESKQARLTYRLKYKTKEGDRQRSAVYNLSLFP